MALPSPSDGDTLLASHIVSIKDHLEGASGSTVAWFFRQLSGNYTVRLSTADGTTKVSIQDSAGAEVASIDSDGNLVATGFTFTNLNIPTSASPSQTTEGRAVWDSDDDLLTIGDGTSRKTFYPGDHRNRNISKAADETFASTTAFQNDDDFTFTAVANTTYLVSLYLRLETSANIKFAWTLPSGDSDGVVLAQGAANTYVPDHWENIASGAEFAGIDTWTVDVLVLHARVAIGGTGGTVTLQWAQKTSNATATTIGANSWMTYEVLS